jgi:hypothetical protein
VRRPLAEAVIVLGLLVAAGVAAAATVRGTAGPDRLVGTPRADALYGLAARDRLDARAGGDFLDGGSGVDNLLAGRGDDRIVAQSDGAQDTIACGPGRDIVTADLVDRVARDCEIVSRQLSRDPYTNADSQHETQVEPDSFAFGSTIVTAFQSGRFFDGGASNIGFATSKDGGRTWTAGFLPGLTVAASPPGRTARASDPVVAYDAIHGIWLIGSLGVSPGVTELLISRSTDGLTWSPPVAAASAISGSLAYDKEWIACDNWPTSPFRGRCYLSYTDLLRRSLATQSSSDGGLTWSPAALGPGLPAVGAIPVPQPNGNVTVVYLAVDEIAATRSLDGGASFSGAVLVSDVVDRDVPFMRAPPLPSADVAADGRIFVAWHDCRFRACRGNDLVLASSSDGVAWSAPARIPIDSAGSPATHFLPAIAVDPAGAGSATRIAVTYYSMPTVACSSTTCRVDAGFVTSGDGGASWRATERLSAQSTPVTWIPATSSGRMLADYIATSFVGGNPVPIFALATEPLAQGRFRQAIFAKPPR